MWLCHDCDALQAEITLPSGSAARCWRCGGVLRQPTAHPLDRSLALVCAAAILFVIGQSFVLVSFDMQGQHHATTLWGAVRTLWLQDARLLASLVFATTQLLPAVELGALLWLLTPLVSGRRPPGGAWVLRLLGRLRPWGMVEVFVLGVLVALVKLSHIGVVVPGVALWAFGALILVFAAAATSFDAQAAWQRMETLA